MNGVSLEVWRYHARLAEKFAEQAMNGRRILANCKWSPIPDAWAASLSGDIFQTSQSAANHARIARIVRDGFDLVTHRGVLTRA